VAAIALVFPPTNAVTVMPPLGLGMLAAVLRERGHAVEVHDLARRHLTLPQLALHLATARPRYVGLSVMTPNFDNAMAVGNLLRALPLPPTVIVGGPHVSVHPERSLFDFNADYVVVREGEEALPALIETLEAGRDPAAIPGLVFRQQDRLVNTGPAPAIEDLDKLPWVAWDLLEPAKYPPIPHQLFVRRLPVAPVLTSRGCPFNCSFCATTWLFGAKLRRRDPENVVGEMAHLADKHGIREFHVEDDNPTLVREHMENFCQALLRTGRRWVWKFPNGVMVNTLDEPLVDLMTRAGCYQISLGIETLSEATKYGKTVEFARVGEIIRWAHARGVQVQGLFIVGLPTEDETTIRRSIRKSTTLGLDFAHYGAFVPLPGSTWGNQAHQAGADFSNINFFTASGLAPLDRRVTKRIQRQAIMEFYFRPRIMWNLLKMIKPRQIRGILYTARRYLWS
jgi:radical SAM superfamily enzyme YgiQ (UPF0313 family)